MTEGLTDMESKVAASVRVFPWWVLLIQGIAALLLGISFLAFPWRTMYVAVIFIGAYWFVSGILALFSLATDKTQMGWKILIGILGIIAGIVILVYPFYSTIILPTMLVIFIGVWGLFIGVAKLAQAFSSKDWGVGIVGILAIILGIIVLVYPYITTVLLPFILGGAGVVFGIATIVTAFMVRKAPSAQVASIG